LHFTIRNVVYYGEVEGPSLIFFGSMGLTSAIFNSLMIMKQICYYLSHHRQCSTTSLSPGDDFPPGNDFPPRGNVPAGRSGPSTGNDCDFPPDDDFRAGGRGPSNFRAGRSGGFKNRQNEPKSMKVKSVPLEKRDPTQFSKGKQTRGFNGCNLVVVEAVFDKNALIGSGTLLAVQDSDRSDEEIDFEWVLTAAHCVTKDAYTGKSSFCDRLRVRVPIESKWDSVQDSEFTAEKPEELFEDIIVPVTENETIFVYKKYFDHPIQDRGTDIALIRIPRTSRPRRTPLKLFSPNIQAVTVAGFPFKLSRDLPAYVPYLSKATEWNVFPQEEKHATVQYACDTSPGQAGGPVCADGAIIGIHKTSGKFSDSTSGSTGILITTPILSWINSVCSEAKDSIYDGKGKFLEIDSKPHGTPGSFKSKPDKATSNLQNLTRPFTDHKRHTSTGAAPYKVKN